MARSSARQKAQSLQAKKIPGWDVKAQERLRRAAKLAQIAPLALVIKLLWRRGSAGARLNQWAAHT